MPVEVIRTLLAQLGTLSLMAGGLVLIVGGTTVVGRAWAGRLILIGVVLAVVGGLVTQDWLP